MGRRTEGPATRETRRRGLRRLANPFEDRRTDDRDREPQRHADDRGRTAGERPGVEEEFGREQYEDHERRTRDRDAADPDQRCRVEGAMGSANVRFLRVASYISWHILAQRSLQAN